MAAMIRTLLLALPLLLTPGLREGWARDRGADGQFSQRRSTHFVLYQDVAIDQSGGLAVFSVFRHTFDAPAFAIAKRAEGRRCDYLVISGQRAIKRGKSIGEVLVIFNKPLRLISQHP